MNFADKLLNAIDEKRNPGIVGLDSDIEKIPMFLQEQFRGRYSEPFEDSAECVFEFNKRIIAAIRDIVPAVKVQIAFYEQYGHYGIRTFKKTVDLARKNGLVVVEDGKRNDIGNTARAYADAHIGKIRMFGKSYPCLDLDCITVNPYLGIDGVQPFINNVKKYGKGIFVLVKTSNPSSGDLQDLESGKKKIYEVMAGLVNKWGEGTEGKRGYASVGAVVGATYPREAKTLRKLMPRAVFLVPGYGAQGGGADDAMPCFNTDGYGAIIHSARGVIYAGTAEDFADKARQAALKMRQDIGAAMKKRGIYPW
jgi:orotidine-5'-phosphate decarboxylase